MPPSFRIFHSKPKCSESTNAMPCRRHRAAIITLGAVKVNIEPHHAPLKFARNDISLQYDLIPTNNVADGCALRCSTPRKQWRIEKLQNRMKLEVKIVQTLPKASGHQGKKCCFKGNGCFHFVSNWPWHEFPKCLACQLYIAKNCVSILPSMDKKWDPIYV